MPPVKNVCAHPLSAPRAIPRISKLPVTKTRRGASPTAPQSRRHLFYISRNVCGRPEEFSKLQKILREGQKLLKNLLEHYSIYLISTVRKPCRKACHSPQALPQSLLLTTPLPHLPHARAHNKKGPPTAKPRRQLLAARRLPPLRPAPAVVPGARARCQPAPPPPLTPEAAPGRPPGHASGSGAAPQPPAPRPIAVPGSAVPVGHAAAQHGPPALLWRGRGARTHPAAPRRLADGGGQPGLCPSSSPSRERGGRSYLPRGAGLKTD
jgi:hypothetical protein